MSQPFYHLRPNKYVDRYLFVNCLGRMDSIINIKSHRYIGFGSYLFDDFKQVHDKLNISSMVSLEADPAVFQRACYNTPYKCIRVINQTSTDFISGGEWGNKRNIIWLDYTSPSEIAQQFSDIASLTNIMERHDIFRVTFNANVSSLGRPDGGFLLSEYRLNRLKERIGEYVPMDITTDDITTSQYPVVILRCLRKMVEGLFLETPFDKRFVLPLFSTVYKDGQMMVTFTGIVLDDHKQEREIKKEFRDLKYVNFEWDKPSTISIPELTVKEMLEMNKLLPAKNAKKQLAKKFNFVFENIDSEAESYISYYKYYPSFQNVNF